MSDLIHTQHLFPILDSKLITLLRSLSDDEWNAPTRAKLWRVKDVAAHLLDTNIRTLSISRDGYTGETPTAIHSYADLVAFLNRLNAGWVAASRRISPRALTDLLESTGAQYIKHMAGLDLHAQAVFSVAWAGQDVSPNWFHIAREYTEKWHHQQQIREAVGKPGIESRELYYPVLDTFMRALPYHYREVQADNGTTVSVVITGEAGGTWAIRREGNAWVFIETPDAPDATISLPDGEAWKLLTKGLLPDEAEKQLTLNGSSALTRPLLTLVAVMA
jgi:uncharacterized protein (TIGR03083 family)